MSLRRVWALGVVAIVLLLAGCTTAQRAGSGSTGPAVGKPNIVLVLTDDLAWNLVSRMPHVVGLQKAGTTFSRYDVVDSLCCPSRSAIFTGEYPHDDGVFTNGGSDGGYGAYNSHGDPAKSFAASLHGVGYRTGFMGKYLNGYQPTDAAPPGWDEWDVAGDGYPEFDYTLNENGKQVRYGHDPKDYLVDVLSGKAGTFIDSSVAARRPFLLEVATFAPHAPYTPAPRYANAAHGVPYPRTAAYDTLPSDPPSWLAGRTPLTAQQQQQLTGSYDKRIEADLAVDDLIGNVQGELKAKGVAGDTYLVFSSDNGYHMGEYRLLAGKQTAFDTDINVPLVVTGPGVPAARTDGHLVSNIDLAPTFDQLAGAKPDPGVDGVSLAALWHGQSPDGWQQAVLVEHHGPDDTPGDPDKQDKRHANPPSYEAVRTATALYVRYASGEQEYYDTAHDPDELHDLGAGAVPPALARQLAALAACHGASQCQAAAKQ